jgi:hypothetical protein
MPLSIDQQTERIVRVSSTLSLLAGMIFFVYSAYVGTFLDGGSTQVFIGLACLFILLAGNLMIERIVLKTYE